MLVFLGRCGNEESFVESWKHKSFGMPALKTAYVLHFGYLGTMIAFMPIYLRDTGLSASQIGSVFSIMATARIIGGLAFSYLADRLRARNRMLQVASAGTAIFLFVLFFVHRFSTLAAAFFGIGLFVGPMIPMLDTTTLDILQHRPQYFGRIRLYGTLSFGVTTVVVGRLVQIWGSAVVLYVVFLAYALMAIDTHLLPDSQLRSPERFNWRTFRQLFRNYHVLFFLGTSFLFSIAFTAYNVFYSLYLKQAGHSESLIGLAWMIATLAEAAYFFAAPRMGHRFSLNALILTVYIVTSLRWLVQGLTTAAGAVLALQSLHAISFGAFYFALVMFVREHFPSSTRTMAQSVILLINYGIAMILGSYITGHVFAAYGGQALFLLAGVVTLVSALVFGAGMALRKSPSR